MAVVADRSIDCLGLFCPMPVVKTREALQRMDPQTEYVMVLDADAIPFPDAIQSFLPYFYEKRNGNGNGHADPVAERLAYLDPNLKADNTSCYFMRWSETRVKKYTTSESERTALLAKHFAHCQQVIFPGVGHLPYEECPEEFNRALIAFLTNDSSRTH